MEQTKSFSIDRPLKLDVWSGVAIFISAVFLHLSKGAGFLSYNQTSYFLYGYRLYDANFIPKDWWTWQTFHHDFAFAYLLKGLIMLGPLHVTAVVADLVLLAILAYGILILCRQYCQHPKLVYVVLITWLGIISPNEIGLGEQYLFFGYLQPSEVAGCLMVTGMALLLLRRFLVAGLLLGIAGFFHGAYLSSFGPAIAVTALAVGVWRRPGHLLAFGIPLALLWGLFTLIVGSAFVHSPPYPDIMNIMIYLLAPTDFLIDRWDLAWTLNWFLWAFLGLVALSDVSSREKFRELRIAFLALLLTALIGMAQAAFLKIPSITLLMLWRSSPMALILAMVLILDRLVILWSGERPLQKHDRFFLICFWITLGVLFCNKWGLDSIRRLTWILTFPLALTAGWIAGARTKVMVKRVQTISLIFFVMMAAVMLKTSVRGLQTAHDYEKAPIPATLGAMEGWIRQHTANDDIFVVPIGMEYMRVRGRRAIVVDWKTSCYLPSDLQEWYRRLCAVCGLPTKPLVQDFHALSDGYRRLDTARAKELKVLYGAQYVVIEKDHRGDVSGLTERYANEDFRVLQIP